MIYGSVCSGIESASTAWHHLGWQPRFFSEIEPFPRAVLAERWPGIPIRGDFTTIQQDTYDPIDLLCAGTPCQDFSVAGLRAGLDGARGNLTLEYVSLSLRLRPRWLVWENVPGIFSIDRGRAFGAFLDYLGQCGYGFAYRVLDAQYFGVPQRRRRVFVIGYLGDWRPAAAVLFEPESLRGDTPPRREAGERVADGIAPSLDAGEFRGPNRNQIGVAIPIYATGHEGANSAAIGLAGDPAMTLDTTSSQSVAYGGNRQSGVLDVATAVNAHGGSHGRLDFESETFVTHSLRANGFDASEDGGVRRLTPRECERLQGFTDVNKTVTIIVCSSAQMKSHVLVEMLSRKAQVSVSRVEESASLPFAQNADQLLTINLLGQDWPVVLNALIDLELKAVQLSRAEKLLWSANDVGQKSLSPLPMRIGDFVRLVALMIIIQDRLIQIGKVESQKNTIFSSHRWNGSKFVIISGQEIDELVKDVALFTSKVNHCLRSTISAAGQSFQSYEQIQQISSCCVAAAIDGFIPEIIKSANLYAIRLKTMQGYTAITYRGKPAADGPRYRALGNSMAVPVMRWLGERITMVESLIP